MEQLSLTDVIAMRHKITHFAKKWVAAVPRFNYLDLRKVPLAYHMSTLRETLSYSSLLLDKAFQTTERLNRLCRVPSEDGPITEIKSVDLFSEDAVSVVDSFCDIRISLDSTYNELVGNLVDTDPDADLVNPAEVFGVDHYKSVLEAAYLLDIRGHALGALKPTVTQIVRTVYGILEALLNSTVDEQQVMIPAYDSADVITIKFEESRVYYSNEELEEIRRKKAEKEAADVRAAAIMTRLSKVGRFVDSLYTVTHSTLFSDPVDQKIVATLFPDEDLRAYAQPTDDEVVALLDDLKQFLADDRPAALLDDSDELVKAMRRLCMMLHGVDIGEDCPLNQKWMSPEQLNRLAKFFVSKGYQVVSLTTMTHLDGDLDTTRRHFREVFVLTNE